MLAVLAAFHDAETVKGADRLIASVRERYTTVKRLAIRPADGVGLTEKHTGAETADPSDLVVTIQFAGPQPSQRPGRLLRELLGADSVEAHPVELGRGRKNQQRFCESPTTSASTLSGERSRSILSPVTCHPALWNRLFTDHSNKRHVPYRPCQRSCGHDNNYCCCTLSPRQHQLLLILLLLYIVLWQQLLFILLLYKLDEVSPPHHFIISSLPFCFRTHATTYKPRP